jgi:hypothetical protein
MPGGFEVGPEGLIVVNLAVEHDGDGAVLVVNWLITGSEVNNRQSSGTHHERDVTVDVPPRPVRAPVVNPVEHIVEYSVVCEPDRPDDSTHYPVQNTRRGLNVAFTRDETVHLTEIDILFCR